jgi:hypothetical protein
MKKTLIAAIAVLIAFAFTACEPKPDPTNTDLLTQKKGWELFSATSVPAYTNIEGKTSENLFEVYFDPCEQDDILTFNADLSAELDYGKIKCSWDGEGKVKPLGLWRFLENEKVLEFKLPYFLDFEDQMFLLEGKISTLDATTLTLRIPITFASVPAKGKAKNIRGIQNAKGDAEYQFILTYKVAK